MAPGDFHLRIVLSNIGTLGDINPLIAIALELKRRGHVPVMALPAVYESEDQATRPRVPRRPTGYRPYQQPSGGDDLRRKEGHGDGAAAIPLSGAAADVRRSSCCGHEARARRPAFARRAELCRTARGRGHRNPLGELCPGSAVVLFRIRPACAASIPAAGAGG